MRSSCAREVCAYASCLPFFRDVIGLFDIAFSQDWTFYRQLYAAELMVTTFYRSRFVYSYPSAASRLSIRVSVAVSFVRSGLLACACLFSASGDVYPG